MEKTRIKTICGLELRKISCTLRALIIAQVFLLVIGAQAWGDHDHEKKVNCNKGETITHALKECDGKPITIQVKGTCNENVTIDRDDVTLIAHPSGGAINGVEPIDATIIIMGDRTVIDGLTVTGGGAGIRVRGNNNMIRNCTVQNVGWNGIPFPDGNGTVDNCKILNSGMNGVSIGGGGSATVTNSTIQNSGYHGVNISGGGRATVTKSTISSNTLRGILVYQGGNGYIDNCTIQNNGDDGILIEAANATVIKSTISSNGSAGIIVSRGGSAKIGMNGGGANDGNTINNNQGSGIFISSGGSAYIRGNTIDGNGTGPNVIHGRSGILVAGATATLFGGNIITNNKHNGIQAVSSSVFIGVEGFVPIENVISGNDNGGIVGFLGSSLDIRYATINGNNGNGVTLDLRSTAMMIGDTISNNTGNGILLSRGGGLSLQNPVVTVTGNTSFGLQCNDAESSFSGNINGISGNYPTHPDYPTEGQVSSTCTGF